MEIRVRILSVADPSMAHAFDPLEASAKRVFAKIYGEQRSFSQRMRTETQRGASEQARAGQSPYRSSGRARDDDTKAHERSEKEKTRATKREAMERQRALKDEARNYADFYSKMARSNEQSRRQMVSDGGVRQREGLRRWSGVGSDLTRMGRAVIGGVGDIARGAGIDPSIAGLTGRVISTEQAALRATLSGMSAEGKTAGAGDVQNTMGAIRGAGDATSQSYSNMADALERFVTKSADLEAGKAMLKDLGDLANASGVNVADLADAAGGLSANMTGYGQTADEAKRKSKDMMEMLRVLAAQGSKGAVEIKDMASYLPKLASAAGMIGGDYATNIAQLGAIAQESMKGGRAAPAEAIRAAQALVGDITKPSVQKHLTAEGIDPWTDKSHTKLRSMEDIITAVYAKTGGDQARIAKLFPNIQSASAIRGFSGIYQEAGGGEAGLQAIRARFREMSTPMTEEQVAAGSALTRGSKAGKAQDIQNRLEAAWGQALEKLVPALEKLTPHLDKVLDGFVRLVTWLAGSPGEAITAAIVGSIAKAAIGEAVASSLRSAVAGGAGGGGAGGAGGGGVSTLGSALTIVAAAVAITAAGVEMIDRGFKSAEKQDDAVRSKGLQSAEDRTNAAVNGDPEAIARLEARNKEIDAALGGAEKVTLGGALGAAGSGLLNYVTGGSEGESWGSYDRRTADYRNRAALSEERMDNERALEKNANKAGMFADSGNEGTIGFLGTKYKSSADILKEARGDTGGAASKGPLKVDNADIVNAQRASAQQIVAAISLLPSQMPNGGDGPISGPGVRK